MKIAVLAVLAALALPAAAQDATPSVGTTASAKPAKAVTPRESARAAKAQNKELRCATKERQPRQKKATAT